MSCDVIDKLNASFGRDVLGDFKTMDKIELAS